MEPTFSMQPQDKEQRREWDIHERLRKCKEEAMESKIHIIKRGLGGQLKERREEEKKYFAARIQERDTERQRRIIAWKRWLLQREAAALDAARFNAKEWDEQQEAARQETEWQTYLTQMEKDDEQWMAQRMKEVALLIYEWIEPAALAAAQAAYKSIVWEEAKKRYYQDPALEECFRFG